MTRKHRQIDAGEGLSFGDLLHDRIIARDHFLVALHGSFPWRMMSAGFTQAHRGIGVVGRRPHDPIQIRKMLSVSFLYRIPERQVEEMVSFLLVVKFVSLAVHEAISDHSTVTSSKNRYPQRVLD